jgi:hypothetical protein
LGVPLDPEVKRERSHLKQLPLGACFPGGRRKTGREARHAAKSRQKVSGFGSAVRDKNFLDPKRMAEIF